MKGASAAVRWLAAHRSGALALAFWAAGLAVGGHVWQLPRYFADSTTYIQWATIRLPMYCLFVTAFGHGAGLVLAQTVLSITAWAWLGWGVGQAAGVAVAVGLALAAPLFQWNLCCLSESFSFSLLALLAAQTLRLLEGGGKAAFLGWALAAAAAGLTRMTNVYVLPFFALPLLARGGRRGLTALAVAAGIYAAVAGVSATRAQDYRRLTLTNVLMGRILPDPEARAYFAARGMPVDDDILAFAGKSSLTVQRELYARHPELQRWVDADGSRVYQGWLLADVRHVAAAWRGLLDYRLRLGGVGIGVELPGAALRLRWAYYQLGRIPGAAWWALALAPLAFSLARGRRPVPSRPLLAAALAGATLAMGFVCFHGECTEMARVMMPTGLLYRVTALVGVAAGIQAWAGRRRPGA